MRELIILFLFMVYILTGCSCSMFKTDDENMSELKRPVIISAIHKEGNSYSAIVILSDSVGKYLKLTYGSAVAITDNYKVGDTLK